MATVTRIPTSAIQTPRADGSNHSAILRQLKEASEVSQRIRGDVGYSYVRVNELVALGLAYINGNGQVILSNGAIAGAPSGPPSGGGGGSGGAGATGPQGPQGPPGIDGEPGPEGDIGPPGLAGAKGAAGDRGSPGDDGNPGEDGAPGSPGPVGPAGATGSTGPAGPIGAPGEDAPPEDTWPIPGPQGPQGNTGPQGFPGPIGAPGDDGVPNDAIPIPGPQGPQGNPGQPGPQGPIGAVGEDGAPGDEFPVPGPQGPQGNTGLQGIQGPAGPPGVAFIDDPYHDDVMQIPGVQGPSGATGAPGALGVIGPPGDDGYPGDDAIIQIFAQSSGAVPVGANPSATIGLAAVNGSATTFMRSDAAPPLSQAISPTWTGNHIFTPTSGTGVVVEGVNGGIGLELFNQSGADGRSVLRFINPANTKTWDIGVDTSGGSTLGWSVRDITRGATPLTISTSGELTMGAPAANTITALFSGATNTANTYVVEILSGSAAGFSSGLLIEAGTNSSDNALLITNAGGATRYARILGNGAFNLGNNGTTDTITGAATGAVTFAAPAANAITVTFDGATNTANTYVVEIISGTASGFSSGLYLQAGTTSADSTLQVSNAAATVGFLHIGGDGSGYIGSNGSTTGLAWTGGTTGGAYTITTPSGGAIPFTIKVTPSSGLAGGLSIMGDGAVQNTSDFQLWQDSTANSSNLHFNNVATGSSIFFQIAGATFMAAGTGLKAITGKDISARGVAYCKTTTTVETRTSTTTLSNSASLQVAIPAAGTYRVELLAFLYSTTAVTDGVTANMNYSGTFTAVGSYYGGYAVYTGGLTAIQSEEFSSTVTTANAQLTSITLGINSAQPSRQHLTGTLIATASGTLAYSFAQSVSGVDTCNLGVGSYLTVTQLS